MGLSLKKIGASIGSVISGAEHAITNNPVGAIQHAIQGAINPTSFLATQVAPRVAPVVSNALNSGASYLNNNTQHTPVIGPVVRNVVSPLMQGYATTASHSGDILSGHNPYHGSMPQIAGQVGSDALNAASLLPIGELARGTQAGFKGAEALLPRIGKAALAGGLYGAGYGTTGALQEQGATPLSVAKSAALSGLVGAATGGAAPVAGAVVGKTVKLAKNLGEEGFLKIATNDPRWMGLNDHIQALNQNREKMSAIGMTETHPAMKQNSQALTDAIKARDLVGKEISQRGSVPIPGTPKEPTPQRRNMRLFDYTDTPMTSGEKAALADLERSKVDVSYTAASNELRQLTKEAGHPEAYKMVIKQISDQNMSQADATKYLQQGLEQMRNSGTNAKIRMGVGETSPKQVAVNALKPKVAQSSKLKVALSDTQQGLINDYPRQLGASEKQALAGGGASRKQVTILQSKIEQAYKAQDLLHASFTDSKPKVTLRELQMGKGLDMSPELVAEAKAGATPAILERNAKATPTKELGMTQERAAATDVVLKSNKKAPPSIQLPKAQAGDIKTARLNAKAVPSLIADRVKPAVEAANSLSPADHALLDNLRTTPAEKLAQQAENPKAFLDAATKAKAYTDYVHALGTGQGQSLPYRQTYGGPLLYDIKDPATADLLGQYQANLRTKPGYALSRTTPDYATGESLGLKRLNQNFAQDLQHDANVRSGHITELSLAKNLNEAFPGQVAVGDLPRGYTQLQVTGGKALSMPTELANKVNARASAPKVTNPILKGYDALNRGLKYFGLGGGTFHGLTTAETVGGQQLTSGNILRHPIQNLRLIADTASPAAFEAHVKQLSGEVHADGLSTLDRAHLAGVTMSPGEILGDANVKFLDKAKHSKLNPIGQVHDLVFGRQIPMAKTTIFRQVTEGLDSRIPADMAKMRQAASAVNNLGGINRAVEGLTPAQAQRAGRFVLATDFTETKARKLVDAVSKGGPQGKIARQMIIGKVIVAALPGLTIAAAAGKLNTPEDWAKEAAKQVLDPQFAISDKTAKGYSKIARVPGTEISELGRIVLPLFQDKADPLSGAKHYAVARSSSGMSTIWSLLTNQDYFGNPVIANNDNGSVDVGKTATNLLAAKGPIPLQNAIKVGQGAINPGEGVLNTIGFRTGINPEDPKYKETQQYFATKDGFTKSLNVNEQTLFNKLNPTSKDKNGKDIKNTLPLTRASDYADLVANPDFAAKYQAYQKSQSSHDPLWDLNPNQLRSYMQAQVISKNDPGGDGTTVTALYKRLPTDFFTKREQYFTDLKSQGVNLPDSTVSKKPQMPDSLVAFSEMYHGLPYGTGARSSALRSADGVAYIAYLDQNKIYNNQERADLGLPPLADSNQYSSRYGSRGNTGAGSVYKYAISRTTGSGKNVGANLSVKSNGITGKKSKVASVNKPKVTIKKSMV